MNLILGRMTKNFNEAWLRVNSCTMHTSCIHNAASSTDNGYPEAYILQAGKGHQDHESSTCLEGPYLQLINLYSSEYQPQNLSASLKFSFNEA